jgi:hypothetical protein
MATSVNITGRLSAVAATKAKQKLQPVHQKSNLRAPEANAWGDMVWPLILGIRQAMQRR